MILTLIGEDNFTKDKCVEKFLCDTLGDRRDDPLAKQILFATDTNIPSIADAVITACDSVSMFSPEQVVVVRKGEALKADDVKSLAKWLSHGPQCKLLMEFEKLDARGELYKTLAKVGEIQKYEVPKQYKMAEWALGTDTKLVSEEIEKVLLFAPDCPKITLELVRTMIVPQREMVSYEINDSFGMRDAKTYTRMLNEMLNNGVSAIQIVGSLYRYSVDLLNFSTLLSKGMQAKDAAAAIGKNDFIFNVKGKAPQCARNWGRPLLCRVIRRLADLDYEIKSGLCSTRIAQELALAALVVR